MHSVWTNGYVVWGDKARRKRSLCLVEVYSQFARLLPSSEGAGEKAQMFSLYRSPVVRAFYQLTGGYRRRVRDVRS